MLMIITTVGETLDLLYWKCPNNNANDNAKDNEHINDDINNGHGLNDRKHIRGLELHMLYSVSQIS